MDHEYKIVDTATAVSLRERNLDAARSLIRSAAHEAFLDEGYVAATMAGIARRAGVARQTVYNLFESKAALLIEVIGAQVAGPPSRDQAADRAEVLATADPHLLLRRFARRHREVVERTAPVLRVALQAAAVDRPVAEHLEATEPQRVAAMSGVVDALAATGALRDDVPVEQLQRGFAVLTSPAVAIAALDGGLDLDALEGWTRMTAAGLLLGP